MFLQDLSPRVLGLFLLATAGAAALAGQGAPGKTTSLDCPGDDTTAIRFFYDTGDYFHFPLIFRAVPKGDSRFNTAPMGFEGRTAYVSKGEMRQLLKELAQSDLPWQVSGKVRPLGSFKEIQSSTDTMEILVVCSKETASAKFDPTKICDTLAPLDTAFKTPRALSEFQGFRLNYGCQVPGFNPDTYTDHR